MSSRFSKCVSCFFALISLALLPVALSAQGTAKPASNGVSADNPSKWDIFAGYSYLAPKGSVSGRRFTAVNYGAIGSVSRYFNKYVGVQGEGDFHSLKEDTPNKDDFSGGSLGLIFRFPTSDITPFVHALVGGERVGSYSLADRWGMVLTAGGGMDYETPLFNHHLAVRVFQVDYQYTHENFDPGVRGNFNIARLSAGVVFHVGSFAPPPSVTISCSASPTSIFPGEPVTATATTTNLDPKLNAIYSWSGTGVTGTGTTATVATGSLAPGNYTVNCAVKEGKPGKEGLKPWQSASGTTSFTVKAYEPPTISCSASPTTIKPGESATVTSIGVSPQNRPLTYSYSASAGTVSGSGTTATFSSTGAPTGAVGITCNVTDDKGQTATANSAVTITAPYVAPIPHTQALCSISFSKDAKRPTRVDNEAKACLDEVALNLQRQSDAKAVIVGESTTAEKTPPKHVKKVHGKPVPLDDLAAERAVNTKDYLVTEKGIDASRVTVTTGATDGQTVEDYLVPAGATFANDVTGTTPVDETAVKAQVRKPLAEKHPARKQAAPKE